MQARVGDGIIVLCQGGQESGGLDAVGVELDLVCGDGGALVGVCDAKV